jgi:phytoene synthase
VAAGPDAFEHCEQLVRAGDKDRFLATLFAPQKYRRALFALYAFNLETASVRERAREPMPGELRLQWWRDAVTGTGHGEVDANPVAAALRDTIVRYRLPPALFERLIEARRFDLYNEPMPSLHDLTRYAADTSAALIEIAARVLGDGRDPGADDLIGHAGVAYAVTGILLALPGHAARGQRYVPDEVLQRHHTQADDLFAGRVTAGWRAALAELRLRARQHLAEAQKLVGAAPQAITPALLPVALMRPVLDRMERRSYDPLRPSALPQWRRQWILWRAARSDLRRAF